MTTDSSDEIEINDLTVSEHANRANECLSIADGYLNVGVEFKSFSSAYLDQMHAYRKLGLAHIEMAKLLATVPDATKEVNDGADGTEGD
jgi:hypothetical protein